tara:strand:+ start:114486 stop:115385 length:900 start_codon:yes stop_codon:yes gene_type:complete
MTHALLQLLGSLQRSVKAFAGKEPFQTAAAISYFTLLSIAPMLLVITGIAGLLLSEAAVQEALVAQIDTLVGRDGASLLQSVLQGVHDEGQGLTSISIGSALVLIGATTVVAQLQKALNKLWGVTADPDNALVGLLRARLISITVIFGVGFLLLVSLATNALLQGLQDYLAGLLPGSFFIWNGLHLAASLGLSTLLFTLIYRYVPDAIIEWRDAWLGGFITALLFGLGKYSIGLYLGQASVGSAYGAAGSAVVFMVWIYYASLIVFFGAQLTAELAAQRGRAVIPSAHAKVAHPARETR